MKQVSLQPFDPLDFLALASKLCEDNSEAHLRTAVGRSYYALFLIARQKTGVIKQKGAHGEVLETLSKKMGKRLLADQLKELMKLRHIADYELTPDESHRDWPANLHRAQLLVEAVLPKLQLL